MSHEHNNDRHTDENLKAFGQMIDLPRNATPLEQARWKTNRTARRYMQMAPFVRFAAAAAVVFSVGTFVYFGSSSNQVEAATIFGSLRSGLWTALQIELNGIDADGVQVDGRIEVNFAEPVSMAGLMDGADEIEVVSTYGKLDVLGSEDANADVTGLDVSIEGGYSEDATWAFVDLRSLPEEAYEEPGAAFVMGMIQGGILVKLDGLADEIVGEGVEEAAVDAAAQGATVNVNVNTVVGEATADADEEDDDGLRIQFGDSFTYDSEDDEGIGQLIEPILRGGAGPEELAALADALEQAAEVTVIERPDGLFVLRAEQIQSDDEEFGEAVVEIGYFEGSGVEWMQVTGIGELGDGTVRIAFTDDLPTDHVSIRDEMLDNGVRVFDVGEWIGMLE